jgi:hypothetical protein
MQDEYCGSCDVRKRILSATTQRRFDMGYDQHQSSSSGAAVAIVVAVLLVGILGVLALAGAWIFLVRLDSSQSQVATVAMDQQVVTELRQGGVTTRVQVPQTSVVVKPDPSDFTVRIDQDGNASVVATPDPKLNFEFKVDREGNASIAGEPLSLDELRVQLSMLKDETANALSVRVNADSECPVKHIIPVLDVCREVGDIDYSIVSSDDADSSANEGNAGSDK